MMYGMPMCITGVQYYGLRIYMKIWTELAGSDVKDDQLSLRIRDGRLLTTQNETVASKPLGPKVIGLIRELDSLKHLDSSPFVIHGIIAVLHMEELSNAKELLQYVSELTKSRRCRCERVV
jgi:hypothetical protein